MNLSLHQTLVVIACLLVLGVLAGLGAVDGSAVTPIITMALGGALGYINGKKSGKIEAGG